MGLVASEESMDCLEPPAKSGEIGRLGPYRVLSPLGRGGMGQVFIAEDSRLQRTIALKVMLKGQAKTLARRQRFVQEARAMAAIKHDNVVTVYEVGEEKGIPYLAMELLKGQPLDKIQKAGPKLSYEQVFEYATGISRGLAAAHARGIIHRDIKPANIWVEEPTGRIKILDFGLALGNGPTEKLTACGAVVGTPGYLSPEQAQGEPLDDRSDLYSVGVVLYELCSGRLPFIAKSIPELLMKIVAHSPERPDSLCKDLPEAYADLIMRLLEKEPKDRVRSATDLEQLINKTTTVVLEQSKNAMQFVVEAPIATGAMTSRSTLSKNRSVSNRTKWIIATAVAIPLHLLVGGWWFAFKPKSSSSPSAQTVGTLPSEVSPASLRPLKIAEVLASSTVVSQGIFARFKIQLENTAEDAANDPRVINAGVKNIAQIQTYVQRDGETRRDAVLFPQQFTIRELPAPGRFKTVEVPLNTLTMSPGSYRVHFELQSPEGSPVQQATKALVVTENFETIDLLGFEVIRTSMGNGADTSLVEGSATDMGGRGYLELHLPRGNEPEKVPLIHAYLRFDLTTRLQPKSKIDRAILLLTPDVGGYRGNSTINAYGLSEDSFTQRFSENWIEKGNDHLTWDDSPSALGIETFPLLGQVVIDNAGGAAERKSEPCRISGPALDDFVRRSGDRVSILLVRSTPGDKATRLIAREGKMEQSPALAIRSVDGKAN